MMMDPLAWLDSLVLVLQQGLYEGLVQPLLFSAGLMAYSEEIYDFTEWFVLGAIEVAVLAAVLIPLERRYSVERVLDRQAIRIDIFYTLLHRLGGFALLAFALLTPLLDALEGKLRLLGLARLDLDAAWPGVTDLPLVSFLIYLVALDFIDYWLHRGQHAFRWWWSLHALHHSQRQMTFWSDQRNHLLDDLLRDVALALVALLVGVAPAQFVALVIATRVLQSVQHANLRWRFGAIGERLIVSPSFHRLHHAIGYGHEGPSKGVNFGVLFPWWDMIFRTVDFRPGFVPTGIRDQLDGRDYGRGFWAQHWLALVRMVGRA
jgi:sterol desaturase/sphingolipid hydroxylase (fatty acid hydroxylase superfamily)